MSFINGRFFYNAGRKFPNGECKELRRIKNSKKLMQVEVVQSPAKKRGRKQGWRWWGKDHWKGKGKDKTILQSSYSFNWVKGKR